MTSGAVKRESYPGSTVPPLKEKRTISDLKKSFSSLWFIVSLYLVGCKKGVITPTTHVNARSYTYRVCGVVFLPYSILNESSLKSLPLDHESLCTIHRCSNIQVNSSVNKLTYTTMSATYSYFLLHLTTTSTKQVDLLFPLSPER